MSFLQILILICSLSLCAVVFLVGFRVYYFRILKREDLYRDLSLSKPFFGDIYLGKVKLGFLVKIFDFKVKWGKRAWFWMRKRFCNLKNLINGNRSVRCEKCEGYWEKLNRIKRKSNN